ncbi:MAG TPA: hypothetical protein ENI73_05900 [Spirochaetes bacterium]|nr:hypothetical protein [Spirochaetota bacterium]
MESNEPTNELDVLIKRSFLSLSKKQLTIRSEDISYEGKRLVFSSVKAIRYGILQIYVNGIKANRIFVIELMDDREDKLKINFQSAMLFKVNKKIDKLYFDIIDVLWQNVTKRLVNQFIDELESGRSVSVGKVEVTPGGIQMQVIRWFKKEEHFLEWGNIRKSMGLGHLHLYSNENKKIKCRINLQKVWNAVVLSSVLDYLWKDGRVYRLAEKHIEQSG